MMTHPSNRTRAMAGHKESVPIQWLGHLLRYATVTPNPNPSFPIIRALIIISSDKDKDGDGKDRMRD
ncbi:hypothetical protein Pyn_29847 [Prunus yedoensis var. nudiflora]|uniref:Uncharacterized protein n=1 Tax=Prunus yedoensis var. nudiflora TaxID=2094558 RepID=A0A315ALE2_PRUYE|nr:hypothetical protein Pyn_29847 [Prunus yedoensis var. nudiflora]